jgi:hypothetical protein
MKGKLRIEIQTGFILGEALFWVRTNWPGLAGDKRFAYAGVETHFGLN